MALPVCTIHFPSLAHHCVAVPLRCFPCCALPMLIISLLRRRVTGLCNSRAPPYSSMPIRCGSVRCFSAAAQLATIPMHHISSDAAAVPLDSVLRRHFSTLFCSMRFPCPSAPLTAALIHHASIRIASQLRRCASHRLSSMPSHRSSWQSHRSGGGKAYASRSSSTSYVNLPLPLFRHWPKPRSSP